ncbi:uncharacterized protein PG998_008834 [Apiospora kogelbergensis]|uniref:uncharacterized protein n=1 Tax=Apiospora kogelbergensis TaxID=1337665 RepID=UPI00312E24A9
MAEAAATAIGIAGAVSVAQSLVKCYDDFLTARSFPNDYAALQVRAALLENSTKTWAVAVGLLQESGGRGSQFLVAQPTEKNIQLATRAMNSIEAQLNDTNKTISSYTTVEPTSQNNPSSSSENLAPPDINDPKPDKKAVVMHRVGDKLHRMVQRQHDALHPGTVKRTRWAMIDKAKLEDTLDTITALVDRLNADFAPAHQNRQLDQYCQGLAGLKLSDEELQEIGELLSDKVSQTVFKMLEGQRLKGDRFCNIQVTKDGDVMIGDYYHKDFQGQHVVRVQSRNDTFEIISVTDTSSLLIGDQFGGRAPMKSAKSANRNLERLRVVNHHSPLLRKLRTLIIPSSNVLTSFYGLYQAVPVEIKHSREDSFLCHVSLTAHHFLFRKFLSFFTV